MTNAGGPVPPQSTDTTEAAPPGGVDQNVVETLGAENGGDPERWRLAVVAGVTLDLPASNPEVLLRESVPPYRELRIQVGMPEGVAVAYAWRGIDTPRPLTHEVVAQLLALHNVSIEAVRIIGRRGQIYFAELDTAGPRGRQVVQCRPSDAITLALRHRLPTPILVAEEVLDGDEMEIPRV